MFLCRFLIYVTVIYNFASHMENDDFCDDAKLGLSFPFMTAIIGRLGFLWYVSPLSLWSLIVPPGRIGDLSTLSLGYRYAVYAKTRLH